ncbi:uncharacterized protein LOC111713166 isoform X2 [Eurytemora carolleeae]|uniref:uncharacterized protein LOC111713166 isoform X2 n=1 Tax=Eurytemora carolleeae TaxID=1294199 RepID=UPI000C768F72|nr:uncharacterized protein LOC111713166 isoform X2 [Eurytemora carolleeae]|eukprot:XP_023343752.1 uncharacterized protein LOC111713166 isoform X2 [Eurytemora affinis]
MMALGFIISSILLFCTHPSSNKSLFEFCSENSDCEANQFCELGRHECKCNKGSRVWMGGCIQAVKYMEECTDDMECRLTDNNMACLQEAKLDSTRCRCEEDYEFNEKDTQCTKIKKEDQIRRSNRSRSGSASYFSRTVDIFLGPVGFSLVFLISLGSFIIYFNIKNSQNREGSAEESPHDNSCEEYSMGSAYSRAPTPPAMYSTANTVLGPTERDEKTDLNKALQKLDSSKPDIIPDDEDNNKTQGENEFDPSSSSSSESGNDEQLAPFQNKDQDQDLAQSQDISQTQDLAQSQDISQTQDQNQDNTGNTSEPNAEVLLAVDNLQTKQSEHSNLSDGYQHCMKAFFNNLAESGDESENFTENRADFRVKKIPVIDEESSLEISEIYVQRQNKYIVERTGSLSFPKSSPDCPVENYTGIIDDIFSPIFQDTIHTKQDEEEDDPAFKADATGKEIADCKKADRPFSNDDDSTVPGVSENKAAENSQTPDEVAVAERADGAPGVERADGAPGVERADEEAVAGRVDGAAGVERTDEEAVANRVNGAAGVERADEVEGGERAKEASGVEKAEIQDTLNPTDKIEDIHFIQGEAKKEEVISDEKLSLIFKEDLDGYINDAFILE